MKKILGLDLGSSSIGWALINEPETESENFQIVGMGVRIIPLSKDENDEFTKGNAISKNATRTFKRGSRRGMHRYKLRKKALVKILQGLNMMPDSELFNLPSLNLYRLRDRGVSEQLSLKEIGRILFHLNQKRGYKSNRKANTDEVEETTEKDTQDPEIENETKNKVSKKTGYLDLIKNRENLIEKENLTIGQFFYSELKKDPFFRIKENIFMRKSYENEFDKIWEKQKGYYPLILTEELKNKIRNEIIYFQRPLKSQKGLVSYCEFESKIFFDKSSNPIKEIKGGPKVAPKSSPLFQVAKIWQELNNIEITSFAAIKNQEKASVDGFNKEGKRSLTIEEKTHLFERLNCGEKITPKEILTILGYKSGYNEYKINLKNEKFMEGNRTLSAIKKVFDKYKENYNDALNFNLQIEQSDRVDPETGELFPAVNSSFEKEPLYKLWHILYSIDDDSNVIKTLTEKWNINLKVATDLSKLDFQKSGYGSMSAKALRNILPHLMKGFQYSKACELAGYNHSNSRTKLENQIRPLVDKIKLYEKNSLRQPVVEKVINQVINLINDLIDEKSGFISIEERNAKDKFEIRVELARDLRQSAEERNKAFKSISEADKKHKAIIELLLPILGSVSKRDIEKYKLWKEFEGISPYEPWKVIGLKELFNKNDGVIYDIEHIIPKSRIFDDSFSNKTICPRHLNSGSKGKNQNTAFDFMKLQGDEVLNNYIEVLKKHLYKKDGISKSKFNKLMMQGDKIPDDFINRQMQETRFISKEVRSLLEQVSRNVYASTGSVTSKLRDLWGWNDILMNLQMEKYRAAGQIELKEFTRDGQVHQVERIKNWSKREDHRHHAIDALTVACTKQSHIQKMNTLNSQHTRDEMYNAAGNNEYERKMSVLEKYLVSQRPFSTDQVSKEAAKILISFKAGKRLFSKSKNKIKAKNGNKLQITLTPRGFLHKETVYGEIKQFEKVKLNPRFSRIDDIADSSARAIVKEHLQNFDGDPKKAFGSKGLSQFEEKHHFTEVTVYSKESVVKYNLNKDFKEKDIESIVDHGIQKKVREHLSKHGNNPKVAFNSENPVWFNKEKKIQIKSVRCKTGNENLQSLHEDVNGRKIDFVSTSNNHHIAIYRDSSGKLQENAVTFWDAFERRKNGLPPIIKNPKETWDAILSSDLDNQQLFSTLPKEDWTFVTSLEQNEMFVFGMTLSEIQNAIENRKYDLISEHLYRVQKLSEGDYAFRHHLETKVDDKFGEIKNEKLALELGKMIRIRSLRAMNGIKVRINKIGKLQLDEKNATTENKKIEQKIMS